MIRQRQVYLQIYPILFQQWENFPLPLNELLPQCDGRPRHRVSPMRHGITSTATETRGSRNFTAVRILLLALGLAAAHTTASAALSARARTQAAIDAVTLAHPNLRSTLVDEPLDVKFV